MAEPISWAIVAVFSSTSATAFTIAGTAVTYASLIAHAVVTAASIGLAYLSSQQAKPKGNPLKRTLKNGVQPRMRVYGRTKTAGVAFVYEVKGALLCIGVAMAAGRIDGYDVIYADDYAITRDPVSHLVTDGHAKNVSWIEPQLGEADQAASELFTLHLPTLWTADHRNRGVATLCGVFKQVTPERRIDRYPNGFPELAAIVRGALLYDPRQGGHVIDDEDTWAWSDNAGLVALDFIRHPDGGRIDPAWIDVASFAAAADACARQVAKYGGGTEAFARCSGPYYFDDPTRATLSRILASCDGNLSEGPDGRLRLTIAAWEEPEVELTDEHISFIEIVKDKSRLVSVNDLRATWVDPARGYAKAEGIPVVDQASIDALGIRLSETFDLDMVPSGSQAYRLTTRHFRRDNPPSKLQLVVGPVGLLCFGQRVIRVRSEIAAIDAVYRVMNLEPNETWTSWSLALSEVTEEMFEDVVPPANPSRTLTLLTPAAIPQPSITVADIVRAGAHYLQLTAVAPVDNSLTLEAEYRVEGAGDDAWTDYQSVISALVLESSARDPGAFESRAWWVTTTGREGPHSDIVVTGIATGTPAFNFDDSANSGYLALI